MHRIIWILLLAITAIAAVYGFAASDLADSHALFALALAAGFFASDQRYWQR